MADHVHAEDPADGKLGKDGQPKLSQEIIRKRYRRTPIGLYHLRERILDLTSTASFVDAILILIAFLAVVSHMGFYPIAVIAFLVVVLFVVTLFQPFLGLIIFTFVMFPIYIYQTPLLAWPFVVAATAMLIYGYKYYRVAVFTYVLFGLAFSPFGYILEVPFFIFAILTIGNKRAITTIVVTMLFVVMFSGITGLQNTGYIAYNANISHPVLENSGITADQVIALDVPSRPAYSLMNFSAGFANGEKAKPKSTYVKTATL